MKKNVLIRLMTAMVAVVPLIAEEKPAEGAKKAGKEEKVELTQEQLEEKFVETLSGATLTGKFSVVVDGKSGDEKEDTYTILSVSKRGSSRRGCGMAGRISRCRFRCW